MEGEEEWEGEECGSLKTRPRKGKIGNAGTDGSSVEEEVTESERCVYMDRDKGIESAYEITGTKFSSIGSFNGEKKLGNDKADFETKNLENQNGLPIVSNHSSPKYMKDEIQSSLPLASSEGQCENGPAKFEPVEGRRSANANGKLPDVSSVAVEIDVERVLEEQETHDLYCPNCNSCITKRVILRKRKRRVPDLQVEAKKREKPQPDLEASSGAAAVIDPSPEARPESPDVFRCLSCFSFFIRTASGGKLFPIFGRNGEGESLQSPRQEPAKNLNCIYSIFELFMGQRPGNEPENATVQVESDTVNSMSPSLNIHGILSDEKNGAINFSAQLTQNLKVNGNSEVKDPQKKPLEDDRKNPISSIPESFMHQDDVGENLVEVSKKNIAENTTTQVESDTVNLMSPSPYIHVTLADEKNSVINLGVQLTQNLKVDGDGEVKDPQKKPLEDDRKIPISSIPESFMHQDVVGENWMEVSKKNIAENTTAQVGGYMVNLVSPLPYIHGTLSDEKNRAINLSAQLTQNLRVNGDSEVKNPQKKPLEDDRKIPISSIPESFMHQDDVGENLVEVSKKKVDNMRQPIEGEEIVPAPEAPEVSETRIEIVQKGVIEAKNREWDILKSIVYGGLIESITSLGVVSSAAGSDATTLNIVALGLANLIGGLFVIAHRLIELKNDQDSSIDQGGKLDRYQETLGRRGHFRLHATVAVLSYMLFGLLPPIIYGFSFQKSDNKEYKLIAVAAASLLCITLLAIGKAKSSKNYGKTVIYYVGIGVMASGLSYVVGVLIKKLLEKLGWFDSSVAAPVSSNLAFPETVTMKSGWASYR